MKTLKRILTLAVIAIMAFSLFACSAGHPRPKSRPEAKRRERTLEKLRRAPKIRGRRRRSKSAFPGGPWMKG